jgi:hypothetical protein
MTAKSDAAAIVTTQNAKNLSTAAGANVVAAAPSAKTAGATAAPRASGFTPVSPEARAAAHAMGASMDGMLATLRERLHEVCHLISQILALAPEGGMTLRTLRSKLALAAGEIGLFAP